MAAHRIPGRRDTDDQLGAIIRKAIGVSGSREHDENAKSKITCDCDKHFPNLDVHLIASVQLIPSVKKILSALFLAALVFGIYAPSLRNGFVWDDTALI